MKMLIRMTIFAAMFTLHGVESPVFSMSDLNATEYILDDGLVISNAVHYQRTINQRVWTHVESTGISFTFSPDRDGNIEFTWDDLLYGDTVGKSFIVFYKSPRLGMCWNPDGIEIRVEELQVQVNDYDGECEADVYGFYSNNVLVTKAWVSRESGIVKVMRVIAGKERIMLRRRKSG